MNVMLEHRVCTCGNIAYRDFQTGPGKFHWCDVCDQYVEDDVVVVEDLFEEVLKEV